MALIHSSLNLDLQHKIWPKAGFQNFNTSIIMQYSCYLSVGINTSVK